MKYDLSSFPGGGVSPENCKLRSVGIHLWFFVLVILANSRKLAVRGGGTDTAAEAYASALGSIEEPDELGRSPKSIL